jgi:hypothetical protein
VLTFVPPDGEGVGHVPVKPVEILVGVVVGVVEERNVLAGELDPKPPPLDTGEVSDQPVQAQRGRWDGASESRRGGTPSHFASNVARCQSR